MRLTHPCPPHFSHHYTYTSYHPRFKPSPLHSLFIPHLISCLSLLYLTNYVERLEVVAQPGKQHNSCKDINIHLGTVLTQGKQPSWRRQRGQAIKCRTPGVGKVWLRCPLHQHAQWHNTVLVKGSTAEKANQVGF